MIYLEKGNKMKREYQTRFKKEMMDFILAHRDIRFSAAEIHDYMTGKGVITNLVTVYRNLDKLTAAGQLIKSKNAADGSAFYQYEDPDEDCENHLHLQCEKCGKVLHVDKSVMESFNVYTKGKLGFHLNCKSSSLTGLCSECAAEESNGS